MKYLHKLHVSALLLLLISLSSNSEGAKLLVIPHNLNSHLMYFGQLAVGLAGEGHNVTVVVASNINVPDWLQKGVNHILKYQVDDPVPYGNSEACNELMVKAASCESMLELLSVYTEMGEKFNAGWMGDCKALLDDKKLVDTIKDARFDLAIMDSVSVNCMFTLPYMIDLPYVVVGVAFYGWIYRNPVLPSFVPSYIGEYSDRMTFFQRVGNTLLEAMVPLFVNYSTHYTEKYTPDKPPRHAINMMENAEMWFLLADLSVLYPRPIMPNMIDIGDIMARPAKPLPGDLQRFMDDSPEGVIFLSLGSFLDHVPERITKKFCEAFARIPYKVIWKSASDPGCENLLHDVDAAMTSSGPGNIHVTKWVPQNDLLPHPNLKLFITHGGINSMIEAINHAVPMLVIPITFDQPFNAHYVHTKGLGTKMKFSSFTADELVENVESMITSEEVKQNLRLHSAILREKPETPAKRASFWINRVIKYGGGHLRTAAFDLHPLQFFMVDVYLFLTVVILALISAIVGLIYCCCKCCKRCLNRKAKKVKTN